MDHRTYCSTLVLTALVLSVAGCSSEPDPSQSVFGGPKDAGVDGAGGQGGLPASECKLSSIKDLDSSPLLDGLATIRTDGQFVYYANSSYGLSRVPVNGGLPDVLQENASTLALSNKRLFSVNAFGEIDEILEPGQSVALATGFSTRFLVATPNALFWSEGGGVTSTLYKLDLDANIVTSLASRPTYVQEVKVDHDAFYWRERASDDGALSRIVRAGLDGQDPVAVVDMVSGLVSFAVGDDLLVISATDGLSVGPSTGGARTGLVPGEGILDAVIADEQIYFSRTDQCVADPNIGNGGPICRGNIFRIPETGGAPMLVVATPGAPTRLALDTACVYWTDVVDNCHVECSGALRAAPRFGTVP